MDLESVCCIALCMPSVGNKDNTNPGYLILDPDSSVDDCCAERSLYVFRPMAELRGHLRVIAVIVKTAPTKTATPASTSPSVPPASVRNPASAAAPTTISTGPTMNRAIRSYPPTFFCIIMSLSCNTRYDSRGYNCIPKFSPTTVARG